MHNDTKELISCHLRKYVEGFESQNKASLSLQNISVANISNMINGKWEKISNELWMTVASQIGVHQVQWVVVETPNFKKLGHLFLDAKQSGIVFGVIGDASVGKTEAAKSFSKKYSHIYHVKCDEFWNRKTFLEEILRSANLDISGSIPEMMIDLVRHVWRTHQPLFVFDEIDKVHDNILCALISIYNRLEGHAGIVVMATDHLKRRIETGIRLNKKGYKELYSRLDKKFIVLKPTSRADIEAIIRANGILDENKIAEIYNDCDYDLRRVKKLVQAAKKKGAI